MESHFKVKFSTLQDAKEDWDRVLAAAKYAPPTFTRAFLTYQTAYIRPSLRNLIDHSAVFYHEGKPVAVFPVTLNYSPSGVELRSHESPMRSPLFVAGLPESVEKKISEAVLDWIGEICRPENIPTVSLTEELRSESLSMFHRKSMERGGSIRVSHGLYVDLSLGEDAIWHKIRKSYRPLINRGKAEWQISVIERDPGIMEEYRKLHLSVAGRVTRPIETWQLQSTALENGDAFMVVIRDQSSALVGGGYFNTSPSEALYSVGVYERTLFDKPLGHVVQWIAIQHMLKKGLRWYCLGERQYPGSPSGPTDKEITISQFKEGFATHVFPKLEVALPMSKTDPNLHGSPS